MLVQQVYNTWPTPRETYTQLYNILHNFTFLQNKNYTHLLQNFQFLPDFTNNSFNFFHFSQHSTWCYKPLQNCTQLLQNPTTFYTTIHNDLKLHTTLHNITNLNKTVHNYTKLYNTIQNPTQFFTTLQNLYTTIQDFTQLYTIV